jgi:hypothetical protein
MDYQTSRSS